MHTIECLIKFGEKQYMEQLKEGHFYFSHAKMFREIEEKLMLKGQGDKLERGSFIPAQRVTMQSYEDPYDIKSIGPSNITLFYQGNDSIPIFCLSICDEKNCIALDNGKRKLSFSSEIKEDIKKHFPNADTAVIFNNPSALRTDLYDSFYNSCMIEPIHYFNCNGFTTDDGQRSMDKEYFDYLMKDNTHKIYDDGKSATQYLLTEESVYRTLLCKDLFFKNEKELRILLPKQSINEPRIFYVQFKLSKPSIVSLSDLFNEKIEI
jgi:hypothetical protein